MRMMNEKIKLYSANEKLIKGWMLSFFPLLIMFSIVQIFEEHLFNN